MINFIAEIGGNHKGNFELAEKLVLDACRSKSNIIKLQLYTAEGLVSKKYDKVRHKHFKKFELTEKEYTYLFEVIKKHGKKSCASIWDTKMFSWAIPHIDIIKVGSGDFTCLPLIYDLLKFKKEIILSTGLSTENDVRKVLEFVKDNCDDDFFRKKVTLMQCTSMYPIPLNEANLAVLDNYSENYDCHIGYSDHTIGTHALKIAICKGVKSIEYHYSLDNADTSFRDNLVSLTKDEVEELWLYHEKVKKIEGNREKKPTTAEIESNHIFSFKRGCYAGRKIKKDERVYIKDLEFKRPLLEGSLSPLFFDKSDKYFVVNQDYEKGDSIKL